MKLVDKNLERDCVDRGSSVHGHSPNGMDDLHFQFKHKHIIKIFSFDEEHPLAWKSS